MKFKKNELKDKDKKLFFINSFLKNMFQGQGYCDFLKKKENRTFSKKNFFGINFSN